MMTTTDRHGWERPKHVPETLVVDFDLYNVLGANDDPQAAFLSVQRNSPDIFWTPHNGGHWVATRAEDVDAMLRDPARFSSERVFLPRDDNTPQTLPTESDGSRHADLRKPLTRALMTQVVAQMEPRVRQLARDLVDRVIAKGQCEFVAEFANVMPMHIFLDLVDLPHEQLHSFLPPVEAFIKGGTREARHEAQMLIYQQISEVVRARRENPGEDLASIVVNCKVGGERISVEEANAYMTLVLLGGLDTIAAVLSHIAHFLAVSPVHRRQLVDRLDDEMFMKSAMEELFRRFGIVNSARIVKQDIIFNGVQFLENDTVLPINMLYGLDERRVDDPLAVDFSRGGAGRHLIFGAGPHTCPGATLARREVMIFLDEWLRRIPEFSLKAGTKPVGHTGVTCSLDALYLTWPTA
ncbi:Cytochrome P450 [Sphingobium faniae]|nr:Cytochrome P450 [Sphingobium faniae]